MWKTRVSYAGAVNPGLDEAMLKRGRDATYFFGQVKTSQSPLSAVTRHVSAATCADSREASGGHVKHSRIYHTIDLPQSLARGEVHLGQPQPRLELPISMARPEFRTLPGSFPDTFKYTGELSRPCIGGVFIYLVQAVVGESYFQLLLRAHLTFSAISFSNSSSSRSKSTPRPSGR
jgi:hypothetical protein